MTRWTWFERPVVSQHTTAVLQALLVTFLWSSSYVLIKIGLQSIPAIIFAGLRYVLATAVLFPIFVGRGHLKTVRQLERRQLAILVLLGLFLYTVTQGAQFVALQYLRVATISLLLNFTPAVVVILAILTLGERPSARQCVGIGVLLAGVVIYFYPFALQSAALVGVIVMLFGLGANAAALILGRRINRGALLSPLVVTTVSMGIGSSVLLAGGFVIQGLPPLTLQSWAIVGWLAVVNTAFAFTLWNKTLQTLSATESSVITNTMLVQIAILGWVFLNEPLSSVDLVGLALVMAGALGVQLSE